MDYIENNELLEKIWEDANFKTSKKPILSGDTIKKNKFIKINEQGKMISACKICNCEIYISSNYGGDYPLCKIHRDPNYRIIKK